MDKDGDYYENDFIDDSEYITNSNRKKKQQQLAIKRTTKEQRVRKKVGVVQESDSEDEGNDSCTKGQVPGSSKRGVAKKRRLFSSESEHSEDDNVFINTKKRRSRWENSDDEIDHTPSRFVVLNM